MDAEHIRTFRATLLAELAELDKKDDLGRDGQKTVNLDQQSVGRLSRMDAMQQQAMAKATWSRRAQSRQRILATLTRMDADEFGYCSECGEDIPTKRLQLDPTVLMEAHTQRHRATANVAARS